MVVTLALTVLTRPVGADDGLVVKILAVDDANFPTLTAIVSIESGGRPLPSVDTVTVTDNGAPVAVDRVTRVKDGAIPTSVVLALDTSGSMAGEKIVRAKEALAGLALRLGPTDSVGLIAFADTAQVILPVAKGNGLVAPVLATLQAQGNTALYAAVAESGRVAAATGIVRRLVILLSDGEEFGNVSGLTREESLTRAAQSGAIFYVIGLGAGSDRSYLAELAARTGGRYLDAPTAADIQAGYTAIEEALKGQFVVALKSSAPAAPLARTMVVTVVEGGRETRAEYAFVSSRALPTSPQPTVAAAASTAAVPPEPTPAAEVNSRSGPPPLLIPLLLVAALLVAGGAGGLMWRRRTQSAIPDDNSFNPPEPRDDARGSRRVEPVATFILLQGHGEGNAPTSIVLTRQPVTVGWAHEAQIQLPQVEGVESNHARLWWRDGTLMLHHLGGGTTAVNGATVRWTSLGEGDSIRFGPFLYEYRATR